MQVALVGAGRWGVNLVRNFFQLGSLFTVCDRNPKVLDRIAKKFPTLHLTHDFEELLKDEAISAIVLATPAATHHDLAKRALMARKHVYVEKPLARREQDAQELIGLADKLGLTLMVGHLLLYHPAVNKLKNLIAEGELGKVRFLNSDRRNLSRSDYDRNVIWDLAPHDLSMISYLLGQESAELIDASGFSTAGDGVVDVAHLDMRFSGNVYAHIHNSWIDPQKQNLLTVHGSRKTAVLDDTRPEGKLKLYQVMSDGQVFSEHPVYSPEEPLNLECQHFLACIEHGDKPLSDGMGGYQVVRLLQRADEMMRQAMNISQGSGEG